MKLEDLIKEMTLEEKASLMSGENFWNTKGIPRLGIPSIMLTDGPHGLRKQGGKADHLGLNKSIPATSFPTAATLANSWDMELLYEVGQYLGQEALAEEVSVLLGPGLNIKRNPLCGRNFEYFSEDPYLSGKLSAAMIQGIQSKGVAACPKHFAVNAQETNRMAVDELVDLRALHEIHLEGFRYAIIEGQAKTIMTSYNKINGVYANEDPTLLDEVLRKQWGFSGLVVSDWLGNNDRVKAVQAGCTLEMPYANGVTDAEIVEAVIKQELDEKILDDRVYELLKAVEDTAPFSRIHDKSAKHSQHLGSSGDCEDARVSIRYSKKEHHQKAIEAACRSMVLLKNQGQILPLKSNGDKVAVIGDFAKNLRYQGAGSSLINPTALSSPLEALKKSSLNIIGYEPGFKRLGGEDRVLLQRAVELAKKADTVLLFCGLSELAETEGIDRKHMKIACNQLGLIYSLIKVHSKIVLILAGGSPVEMPFTRQVQGILHSYLPGQGGGEAIKRVLTGQYNPSGKLAETYPIKYAHVPSASYYPGKEKTAQHRESIYIGYRYYDTADVKVRFPFGFGLSYTAFEYSDLKVKDNQQVSLTVKNIGSTSGEEVVQIYIQALEGRVFRPLKELKGFAKILLAPGESKKVEIALDEHAYAYYHATKKQWIVEGGKYAVYAAASSCDLRLETMVEILTQEEPLPYDEKDIPSYVTGDVSNVSEEEFEALLGFSLPDALWDRSEKLGVEDTIAQCQYAGPFGRFLYGFAGFVSWVLLKLGRPIASNYIQFPLSFPFKRLARIPGSNVNLARIDGFLLMVNGEFLKGLVRFLRK